MSHGDKVIKLPEKFNVIANTSNSCCAAFNYENIWGVQFHPEVDNTDYGVNILSNFSNKICNVNNNWNAQNFINNTIVSIKDSVGKSNVICGISGGVDSSIAATLIHRAIGKQLTSIFVDNGLLRKNEPENVMNFLNCLIVLSFK